MLQLKRFNISNDNVFADNVKAFVGAAVNSGVKFSAHAITQAMRNALPAINIEHEHVRPIVHVFMGQVMEWSAKDVGAWIEYVPDGVVPLDEVKVSFKEADSPTDPKPFVGWISTDTTMMSSFIESVSYKADIKRMIVKIHGRDYSHDNVSPEVYKHFMNAPSLGAYYNMNFR